VEKKGKGQQKFDLSDTGEKENLPGKSRREKKKNCSEDKLKNWDQKTNKKKRWGARQKAFTS